MDIKEAREIWEQIDEFSEMDMMDVFVNAQTTIIEYQQRQIEKQITEPAKQLNADRFSERLCKCTKGC